MANESYTILTEQEVNLWKKISNETEFHSWFNFLKSHNGWRDGKLHTFLGVSHGGKSTLVRTLVLDALSAKKKVGLVLSEETKQEFQTELSYSGFDYKTLDGLSIFSELDHDISNERDFYLGMEDFCSSEQPDIIFYDNITTSSAYLDRATKEQSAVARRLKAFAISKNVPLVTFAHTGGQITEGYAGLIDMNDIRGSKTITNISHFFYIMQSFHVENDRYNTLRIVKHRGQMVKNVFYKLFYYGGKRIFGKDEESSFTDFKEIFQKRNKL